MARKCMLERDLKRRKLVKKCAAKRETLVSAARDKEAAPEERFAAMLKLAKMPRNGARIRLRNRCQLTGRGNGVYRKFKICRIKLRELASAGQIPGMRKSSW